MANQQLVDYINTYTAQGHTYNDLKTFLTQQGYQTKDIDDAIAVAKQGAQKPVVQNTQVPRSQTTNMSPGTTGIKHRNPLLVIIFTFITFGIYAVYWVVSTTNELRRNTKSAPNPWLMLLMLIPFVNLFVALYYYWLYSKALNELTGFDKTVLFLLWIVFCPVAMYLVQVELNKKSS